MAECVRKFKYVDNTVDTSSRFSGWQLVNTPAFDPMSIAYTVVHDAVEHYKPGESGIENEMMAFGSLYHIRVLGGWWEQFGFAVSPVKMIAWDMARFLAERGFEIEECSKPVSRVLDATLCDALEYYKDRLAVFHGVDTAHSDYVKALHAFRKAAAWLSRGYTRSLKRWHQNKPQAITAMFISLTKLIEQVNETVHGDTLILRFNTQNLNHSVYHSCNG